jgi:hypothetical protein
VPGQWVRIGVDVDGVRMWRAYSLTSHLDRPDGCIAITVKAIPGGKVSNHLVHRTRPGTLVHLDQATGEFVLPSPVPGKALFVTAGSGITPVMGILRNHTGLTDVVVVHSAPTADDVVFGASCASWPPPAGSGWSSSTPTPPGCSTRPRSPPWSPTWPSAPPGPAARSACSRPWRSTGTPPASPTGCSPSASGPPSSSPARAAR